MAYMYCEVQINVLAAESNLTRLYVRYVGFHVHVRFLPNKNRRTLALADAGSTAKNRFRYN